MTGAIYGLQRSSDGVHYEGYTGEWHTCTYQQTVDNKDETYIFRCPAHLECCGNQCGEGCAAVADIPWFLILLFVLLFLVLLGLCGLLSYCLYKYLKRKPAPQKYVVATPPKVSTLTRPVQTDPIEPPKPEKQIEYYPLIVEKTAPPPDSHAVHVQTEPPERPFVPDPMDEIEMPHVEPTPLEYHGSELTEERQPLFSRAQQPREHQAQYMRLHPGHDQVAAY